MFDKWQTMQGILADVLLDFTLAGEVGYVLLGGGTEREVRLRVSLIVI